MDIVESLSTLLDRIKSNAEREIALLEMGYVKTPTYILLKPVPDHIKLTQFNVWQYGYVGGYTFVHKETGKTLTEQLVTEFKEDDKNEANTE